MSTRRTNAIVNAPLTRFMWVGAIGFITEALMVQIMTGQAGWNAYAARGASFPVAVLVTWLLNRAFTFRSQAAPAAEAARYFVAQSCGAMCNLATYAACLSSWPQLQHQPLVALAVGSGMGLTVNFMLSRSWVFGSRSVSRHDL